MVEMSLLWWDRNALLGGGSTLAGEAEIKILGGQLGLVMPIKLQLLRSRESVQSETRL
jgi:hypothetical protein